MRPIFAYVSKKAIFFNIQKLKQLAPLSKICIVAKANAYGHHVDGIINELQTADYLAVSSSEEALLIRKAEETKETESTKIHTKIPIILLEGVFELYEYSVCISQHFQAVIMHEYQLDLLEQYAHAQKDQQSAPIDIWLKIETGMNRLGLSLENINNVIDRLNDLKTIYKIVGNINVLTHFACADEPSHLLNTKQIHNFDNFNNFDNHYKSSCNSAGILNFPDMHSDVIRAGIITYGVSPLSEKTGSDLGFIPVMTFQTKVISIKKIKKGETIGYGATFIAQNDFTVAIIASGYADGYPREISEDAYVYIENTKAKIIGKISMDMTCIDISHIKEPKIGMDVILWGKEIPVELVAKWANTIPYTLLTRLASRVHFRFC